MEISNVYTPELWMLAPGSNESLLRTREREVEAVLSGGPALLIYRLRSGKRLPAANDIFHETADLLHIAGDVASWFISSGELQRLPQLKILLLEEAQPKQVRAALDAGVPYILLGIETIRAFYRALAQGYFLPESVAMASGPQVAEYELESDQWTWPADAQAVQNPYVTLPEEWRLPAVMPEVLPLAAVPEPEPAGSQWSMGIFSLAILSLIIIFWIGSSQRPVAPEFSCPFEADSLYHVLMLPPAAQDSQLRLRADSFFRAYPGKYRFQLVEKLPRDGVSRLFAGCHTDLVLEAKADTFAGSVMWTMYYESGPGAVQQGKVAFPQKDSSYTSAEESAFLENLVFRARAMSAFGQENYAEALYWFRNLPEPIFSQEPALLQRLAQSCVQVKEDDEARQHYDRLLLIDTANAAAYHERGGVLVRKRDYTAAREDFRRAVSLDSTLYDAWYNLGLLLMNTESYEEAEPVARRLLRLKPGEARSQALMAATCAGMQDRDCLISYLREARKLGLDVEEFLTYVPVFQPYRSDPEIKALLQ